MSGEIGPELINWQKVEELIGRLITLERKVFNLEQKIKEFEK